MRTPREDLQFRRRPWMMDDGRKDVSAKAPAKNRESARQFWTFLKKLNLSVFDRSVLKMIARKFYEE